MHSSAGPCRESLPFHCCQWGFHSYIFDLKTMFLECCVLCLIVSNRDQLFKFFNQSISMTCTAFKRPTKKLGMHGLFILGLGSTFTTTQLPVPIRLKPAQSFSFNLLFTTKKYDECFLKYFTIFLSRALDDFDR